jgi:uncharacterized protein
MDSVMSVASAFLLYAGIAGLCLAGVLISCLGLSGTWLVAAATLLALLYPGSGFEAWWLLLLFLLLAGLIELAEFLASGWGVRRRGGSRLAGFGAVVGGILGLILGSFIPIPFFGALLGMLAGSFALAYAIEYQRLKIHQQAGNIAFGAVTARIMIVILKVSAALGMSLALLAGLLFAG